MAKRSVRCPSISREGDEGSYLSSVSDLMSGLLFIFIFALMIFIMHANKKATEAENMTRQLMDEKKHMQAIQEELQDIKSNLMKKTIEAEEMAQQLMLEKQNTQEIQNHLQDIQSRLTNNNQARQILLERIADNIEAKAQIRLKVDAERGILRIPESAISFQTGSAEVNTQNQKRLENIASVLASEVICFAPNTSEFKTKYCQKVNPFHNELDAIFIEGHTDNQAFLGDKLGAMNRNLSTARSNTVYHYLVQTHSVLNDLTNRLGQKIFSISGYGSERPLKGHEHLTSTDDPANRRIEFRFIFSEPKITEKEESLLQNKKDMN